MTRHRAERPAGGPFGRLRGAGRSGFALMDLMVSVLILGLFLVPLTLTRNNVITMTGETIALRKARILAAAKMGEMELANPADLVDAAGDFGEDHPGFLWETKVEIVPLADLIGDETEEEDETAFGDLEEASEEETILYEVVRLTLVIRFSVEGGPVIEEDVPDIDKEAAARPLDRVVIVRTFLKETETEGEGR